MGEQYKHRAAKQSGGVSYPNGESLVAKNIISLYSNLNRIGYVESCVNLQGPPYKTKYFQVTDTSYFSFGGSIVKAFIKKLLEI